MENIVNYLLTYLSNEEWKAVITERGKLFSRLSYWQKFLTGKMRGGVRTIIEEPHGQKTTSNLEQRIERLIQTVRAQQARDQLKQESENEAIRAKSRLEKAAGKKRKQAAREILQDWEKWRGAKGDVNYEALIYEALILVEQLINILSIKEMQEFVESNPAFRLWLEDALLGEEAEPLDYGNMADKELREDMQTYREERRENIKRILGLSGGKATKKK